MSSSSTADIIELYGFTMTYVRTFISLSPTLLITFGLGQSDFTLPKRKRFVSIPLNFFLVTDDKSGCLSLNKRQVWSILIHFYYLLIINTANNYSLMIYFTISHLVNFSMSWVNKNLFQDD